LFFFCCGWFYSCTKIIRLGMLCLSIWFVWTQMATIKGTLFAGMAAIDTLLFLVIPASYLPFVANGFCYALLMVWIIVVVCICSSLLYAILM